ALLLAALVTSRGLFAQGAVDSPAADSNVVDLRGAPAITPADQLKVLLHPVEIRYVQQESVLLPATGSIKGLYVNAWVFGSPKLWQLVRLADETEINAFVVDVKDDTGCLLYPSAVPTAQQIGANQCVRAKDARARLDSLHAHGIYPIARIVVAKDPLLAERKPQWSVKDRDTGGLWRDRINIAWVDAYNDSVWIYAAQLAQEAARMGFAEVQFDYVRFPDEPRERMATAIFPAHRRLRRDPAVPAGVHAGPAPASLHAVRDPRTDSCRGRPRHHIVGAVESPQRVPAGRAASQARQPASRAAGAVDGERRPVAPPVRAGTRAPCRAATR